ncbi:uncharacterized protein [Musca autumnalis]|uniref:uncharacterized protein n=1 Tax=Musca autumnalis TaxID=221902 RepID=UPI003CEF7C86
MELSENYLEAIRVSIDGFSTNGTPLKITTFYRSPKCNITTFLMYLENELCGRCSTMSIVVGDANIDTINLSGSSDILSVLSSVGYEICHTLVTRPSSKKSLDHVYSNEANRLHINAIECELSDHNIIWCQMISKLQSNQTTRRSFKRYNYNNITTDINTYAQNFSCCGNPSSDIKNITSKISDIVNVNTTVHVRDVLSKTFITPWENENLQALRKFKNNLLAKRRKNGRNPTNEYTLKQISRIIKIASNASMNSYVSENMERYGENPRKCWQFINECLGRKKVKQILLRNERNEIIDDDVIKCNTFNEYFLNIPQTLKSTLQYNVGDDFDYFNSLKQTSSRFSLVAVNRADVEEVIDNFDISKSPGYDGITGKVLKLTKNCISPHFAFIFNKIIETSTYPEVLKTAKIVPIPKSENACTVSNFRPVAVLPLIDKLYEKLICKQLETFLEETSQMYPLQFGFKKRSGTQEAIVYVVNTICEALDSNYAQPLLNHVQMICTFSAAA